MILEKRKAPGEGDIKILRGIVYHDQVAGRAGSMPGKLHIISGTRGSDGVITESNNVLPQTQVRLG